MPFTSTQPRCPRWPQRARAYALARQRNAILGTELFLSIGSLRPMCLFAWVRTVTLRLICSRTHEILNTIYDSRKWNARFWRLQPAFQPWRNDSLSVLLLAAHEAWAITVARSTRQHRLTFSRLIWPTHRSPVLHR